MNLKTSYSFACAAVAALVAAGSLAGCFSERQTFMPPTGQELCTGTQPANVVRIQDFAFSPAVSTVPRGTEVTFVNCGAQQHTATSDNGVFDSDLLVQYATFTYTFETAGNYPYHCDPHPFMKAQITVS